MENEIKRIAVLGAGAMGAYFASRFYDSGFDTQLVARDTRLETLRRDGLVINGKEYHIPAIDPLEADSPADLILVALKHHHLHDALQTLDKLVGADTIFISVMNGLDSEGMIAERFGREKVLYAISLTIDALREGNQITYTKSGLHQFGEAQNLSLSPRVRRVQAAFDKAGITHDTPADMLRRMWWKFMVNVGINQASAVTGGRYGVFQTDPHAQWLMETLMREAVSLARAAGVNLSDEDVTGFYPILNQLSPIGKTSMLQDIDAQRKTEVELFSGRAIELGKQFGVPTPVNETVYHIIRSLEEHYGA